MMRTFAFRFVLLFFIALIPLLLFSALALGPNRNLKEIAQQTANEWDRLLRLRSQQVFTIAAFPSVRAFASSEPSARAGRAAVTLNELQAWVASDTNVREVFITDAQGIVIMTTLDGWNADLAARNFAQDALRGQLAVAPVAKDRGEFSTFYAAPILNNRQEIAGALVIRVAAQELWQVTPRGENYSVILADENGVRLDDSGNPALRLVSLGALDTERVTRIVSAKTYGAEMLQPRATNLARAQQLITQGALDQLNASDLTADAFAAQRLVSKPLYVLVLSQTMFAQLAAPLALPLVAAFLLALGGAFLLTRI
jgi:hypothetical protein